MRPTCITLGLTLALGFALSSSAACLDHVGFGVPCAGDADCDEALVCDSVTKLCADGPTGTSSHATSLEAPDAGPAHPGDSPPDTDAGPPPHDGPGDGAGGDGHGDKHDGDGGGHDSGVFCVDDGDAGTFCL